MAEHAPPRARVRLWGVRGTCPSPGAHTVRFGGNTACVEVRTTQNDVVILDAGTGIRALGASMSHERTERPVHLFLSHRHGDHVVGLSHFAPLVSQQRDVRLYCGNADAQALQPFIADVLSHPLFPSIAGVTKRVSYHDWDGANGVTVGELQVRRLAARHPGEAAIALLVSDDVPLLAFAPDNELDFASSDAAVLEWRDALAAAMRGVHLLIHDATYVDSELPSHRGWGHSSATEATRFAVACDAERLLLFHHHPDRNDDAVSRTVLECRALALALGSAVHVDAAAEGMTLELPVRRTELARAFDRQ